MELRKTALHTKINALRVFWPENICIPVIIRACAKVRKICAMLIFSEEERSGEKRREAEKSGEKRRRRFWLCHIIEQYIL
jgi:hypothetical protein